MDKQVVLIIITTWILSLLTTLAFVYVVPSVFPIQTSSPIQIVKFIEPDEVNVTGRAKQPYSFVWTPENPSSNAILAVLCSLEYRCGNPDPEVWDGFGWRFGIQIYVENRGGSYEVVIGADNLEEWNQSGATEWTQACILVSESKIGVRQHRDLWIMPNQQNYTVTLDTFQRESQAPEFISTPTYIRNVNILLEVVDG